MTIKNLFAIILKLIGFLFIIFIFTAFIPDQINILSRLELFYPEEITAYQFPLVTIVIILLIICIIYYVMIFKTEIIMRFLRVEKYFGNQKIENNGISIEKYIQIAILFTSVILLIFNIPRFIEDTVSYFSFEEDYRENLTYTFLTSGITLFIAIILLLFSDKISVYLSKK